MRLATASTVLILASSCGTPRTWAIQQAAFDHRCPEEKIRILRTSADRRSLELDVCGKARRYQDLSREGMTWVDVTGCPPADTPSGAR